MSWFKLYIISLLIICGVHMYFRGQKQATVTDIYCVLFNVALIALWKL